MKLNNNIIEVLEILKDKNKPLFLKEIVNSFSLSINPKTVIRILNNLIKAKRVKKDAYTNAAKYSLDDVRRYYKKFDFLYIHKKDEVAGYLFNKS